MEIETNLEEQTWIFGYGSLMWRPGFDYLEKRLACVYGFRRNFCQASHDHRGTPDHPGRVVTLQPDSESRCEGIAFRVKAPAEGVFRYLDIREQDGYERQVLCLNFKDGSSDVGVTWIASEGNPSWIGGEALNDVAHHISRSKGFSGSNIDYLFALENELNRLSIADTYIDQLCEQVRIIKN